jgi:prepilin-type N-terminal cleavage/methylation domain-containing protein
MTATQSTDRASMIARLRQRLQQEEGFGLTELLISLVILSVAMAALMGLFTGTAYSLTRAGERGTAGIVMDRAFEYYRRAPWRHVRLVGTSTDTTYTSQCSGCPLNASSVVVNEAVDGDTLGSDPDSPTDNNVATCNVGINSTDPDVDSTAPLTNCLPIKDIDGADGRPYRVYTYMKYACKREPWVATKTYQRDSAASDLEDDVIYNNIYYDSIQEPGNVGHTPGVSPTWWQVAPCAPDYTTKLVTIIVRAVKEGAVNTSQQGILAQQTVAFSFQSFTTTAEIG